MPDRSDRAGPSERQAAARAALAAALSAAEASSPAGESSPAGSGSRPAAGSRSRRNSAVEDDGTPGAEQPEDPAERARQLCLGLLTGRPRTRTELADALGRHGIPDETAAAVLARLADVGLIDDAAFARAWVESRHHHRGLARRALSAELKRRGVGGQDIEAAVSALDPADEMATARQLVDKALGSSRGKPLPVRIRRLVGLLARKGYPAPVAYRIVREAIEQEGADAAGAGVALDEAAWAAPDADLDAG